MIELERTIERTFQTGHLIDLDGSKVLVVQNDSDEAKLIGAIMQKKDMQIVDLREDVPTRYFEMKGHDGKDVYTTFEFGYGRVKLPKNHEPKVTSDDPKVLTVPDIKGQGLVVQDNCGGQVGLVLTVSSYNGIRHSSVVRPIKNHHFKPITLDEYQMLVGLFGTSGSDFKPQEYRSGRPRAPE